MIVAAGKGTRLWSAQFSFSIIESALDQTALRVNLAETAQRLLTNLWTKDLASQLISSSSRLKASIRAHGSNWRSRHAPRRCCVTLISRKFSILDVKAEILFASQSICQVKHFRHGCEAMAQCL